jgi:peptidoglycan/xylan/chitin deacetylase (PgdA/CDA1 family)
MTTIAKYPGNRRTAFMLQFDDNCYTHLDVVIPALQKRKIAGVFYINCARPNYPDRKAEWQAAFRDPLVIIANHTWSHVGATSVEQMDDEITKANDAIRELVPGKWPRLVSFARPGGVPWTVTEEETLNCLAKHHLVRRPAFLGPVLQQKAVADSVATIDKALATGEPGHLDFHGVGGDWLVTPTDWFNAILDRIEANLADIWTTDPASLHKYQFERDTGFVKELARTNEAISQRLTSTADPSLYDAPLTLLTPVPWTACRITQGGRAIDAIVTDGIARYDAMPDGSEIRVERA